MWMTVDPGFGGTGYAVWHDRTRKRLLYDPPAAHGVINPPSAEKELEERGAWLFSEFKRTIIRYTGMWQKIGQPITIYIEWPEFFGSTGKGHSAAGRGDFAKLLFAASCIAGAAFSQECDVHFIPVTMWKGQLPKSVVAKRVARCLKCPANRYPNHAMDAVGLGVWVMQNLSSGTSTPTASVLRC